MKRLFTFITALLFLAANSYSQNVLILWDFSTGEPSTLSLKSFLESKGMQVSLSGQSEIYWDNTNPSSDNFSAIIHLAGYTFTSAMPNEGQDALIDFVQNKGGKYITFEWNAYKLYSGYYQQSMSDILLFEYTTGASSTGFVNPTSNYVNSSLFNNVTFPFSLSTTYTNGGLRQFATNPSELVLEFSNIPFAAKRVFGNGEILHFNSTPNYNEDQTLALPEIQEIIANFIGYSTSMDTSVVNVTACGEYTWINGVTYTASTDSVYHQVVDTLGETSVLNLHLIINAIPSTQITQTSYSLIADQQDANYQWLDCLDGMNPIDQADNYEFVYSANGSYAVEVTKNGCVDTSVCIDIFTVDLNNINTSNSIYFYPNPTDGKINVTINNGAQNTSVEILSIDGRVLNSVMFAAGNNIIDISVYDSGVYFIKLDGKEVYKILKM